MHLNKGILLIIGFSKLATKFTELEYHEKYNKIIISRRKVDNIYKKNTKIFQFKNRKKIINAVSKSKNIIVINTSATYEKNITNFCNNKDGNHIFPKRVIEFIPNKKIKKIINIDTALDKNINRYSRRKRKHSSWLKKYSQKNKINYINLVTESFYYLDGNPGSFIDYLFSCMHASIEAKIINGEQYRDFISSHQVLLAINKSVELKIGHKLSSKINLCTGSLYRIKDIPALISNSFNRELKYTLDSVLYANEEQYNKPNSYQRFKLLIKAEIKNLKDDLSCRRGRVG